MFEGYRDLEWEALHEPIDIVNIHNTSYLPDGTKKISITRDESYKIKANIFGVSTNFTDNREDSETIPGKLISTFDIEGYLSNTSIVCRLKDCFISGMKHNYKNEGSYFSRSFEGGLRVNEVCLKSLSDRETAWLSEWYISGPSNESLFFFRGTERVHSKNYSRLRHGIDQNKKDFYSCLQSVSSRDYAFIETNGIKFIISRVPKQLGPKWSNNYSIEYRKEWGIPTLEVRKRISEIVSFILGKQLLCVGFSEYDEQGYFVKKVAMSPWGNNVIHASKQPELPPIHFDHGRMGLFEKVLSDLIPQYLNLCEELDLSAVLWRYWVSKNQPIGIGLPILHSGVEILAKAWAKSNMSKRKGIYLPKEDYEKLLGPEYEIIKNRLLFTEYGNRMVSKISRANEMSQNEMLHSFFDEICLPIGIHENNALRARNKMTHDTLSASNEREIMEAIRLTNAYKAFFHRIILKVLGYTGPYVDYSTYGYPERDINEPIGSS